MSTEINWDQAIAVSEQMENWLKTVQDLGVLVKAAKAAESVIERSAGLAERLQGQTLEAQAEADLITHTLATAKAESESLLARYKQEVNEAKETRDREIAKYKADLENYVEAYKVEKGNLDASLESTVKSTKEAIQQMREKYDLAEATLRREVAVWEQKLTEAKAEYDAFKSRL